jgi:hypothetical protein
VLFIAWLGVSAPPFFIPLNAGYFKLRISKVLAGAMSLTAAQITIRIKIKSFTHHGLAGNTRPRELGVGVRWDRILR